MHFLHAVWSARPLPFVWPYWVPFWGVFVWAFGPERAIVNESRKRMKGQEQSPDAGSIRVILLGMQLAWLAAMALAWVPALRVLPPAAAVMFWAGLLLVIAGSLFRRHCWRMLGESFTGEVRADSDQVVVTRGAYAWLRHPSYTAGMVLWLGIGVAFGSWTGTALLVAASFVTYSYRIAVEERTLLAVIGEPYRAFCATRKRLIPFVY